MEGTKSPIVDARLTAGCIRVLWHWHWELRNDSNKSSILQVLTLPEAECFDKLLNNICAEKPLLPKGEDPTQFLGRINPILNKVPDAYRLRKLLYLELEPDLSIEELKRPGVLTDLFHCWHYQEEKACDAEQFKVVRELREKMCRYAAQTTDGDLLAEHFAWLQSRDLIKTWKQFKKGVPEQMLALLPAAKEMAENLKPKAKTKPLPATARKQRKQPKPQKQSWMKDLQAKADAGEIDACFTILMKDHNGKAALRRPLQEVLKALVKGSEWDKIWQLRALKVWQPEDDKFLDDFATCEATHASGLFETIERKRPKRWNDRLSKVWALCTNRLNQVELDHLRSGLRKVAPANGQPRESYLKILDAHAAKTQANGNKKKRRPPAERRKKKPEKDVKIADLASADAATKTQTLLDLCVGNELSDAALCEAIGNDASLLETLPKGYAQNKNMRGKVFHGLLRLAGLFTKEPEMLDAIGKAIVLPPFKNLEGGTYQAIYDLSNTMFRALVALSKEQFDRCPNAGGKLARRLSRIKNARGRDQNSLTLLTRVYECRRDPRNVKSLCDATTLLAVAPATKQADFKIVEPRYLVLLEAFRRAVDEKPNGYSIKLAQAGELLLDLAEHNRARLQNRWSLTVRAYSRAGKEWIDRAYALFLNGKSYEKEYRRLAVVELLEGLAKDREPLHHEIRLCAVLDIAIREKLIDTAQVVSLLETLLSRKSSTRHTAAIQVVAKARQAKLLGEGSAKTWAKTLLGAIQTLRETEQISVLQCFLSFQPDCGGASVYAGLIAQHPDPQTLFDALEILRSVPGGTEATLKLFNDLPTNLPFAPVVAGRLDHLGENVPGKVAEQWAPLRAAQKLADKVRAGQPELDSWKPVADAGELGAILNDRMCVHILRKQAREGLANLAEIEESFMALVERLKKESFAGHPGDLRLLQRDICVRLIGEPDGIERIAFSFTETRRVALYANNQPALLDTYCELLAFASIGQSADIVGALWDVILKSSDRVETFYLDLLREWEGERKACENTDACVRAIAIATTERAAKVRGTVFASVCCQVAKDFLMRTFGSELVSRDGRAIILVDVMTPIGKMPELVGHFYEFATETMQALPVNMREVKTEQLARLRTAVGFSQRPKHLCELSPQGFRHAVNTEKISDDDRKRLIVCLNRGKTNLAEIILRTYGDAIKHVPIGTVVERYQQMLTLLSLFRDQPKWRVWVIVHLGKNISLPKKGEKVPEEELKLLKRVRRQCILNSLETSTTGFLMCMPAVVTKFFLNWPYELNNEDQLLRSVLRVKAPGRKKEDLRAAANVLVKAAITGNIDSEVLQGCYMSLLEHVETKFSPTAAKQLVAIAKSHIRLGTNSTARLRLWRLEVRVLSRINLLEACRLYRELPVGPVDLRIASLELLYYLAKSPDPMYHGEALKLVVHAAYASGHLDSDTVKRFLVQPLTKDSVRTKLETAAYCANTLSRLVEQDGAVHAKLVDGVETPSDLLHALELIVGSPNAMTLLRQLLNRVKEPDSLAAVVGTMVVLNSNEQPVKQSWLKPLNGEPKLLAAAKAVLRFEEGACSDDDPYVNAILLQAASLHFPRFSRERPSVYARQAHMCEEILHRSIGCANALSIMPLIRARAARRALALTLLQKRPDLKAPALPSFDHMRPDDWYDFATLLAMSWPTDDLPRLWRHLRAQKGMNIDSVLFRWTLRLPKVTADALRAVLREFTEDRTPEGRDLAVCLWSHILNRSLMSGHEMCELLIATVEPLARDPELMKPFYSTAISIVNSFPLEGVVRGNMLTRLRDLVGVPQPENGALRLTKNGFVAFKPNE